MELHENKTSKTVLLFVCYDRVVLVVLLKTRAREAQSKHSKAVLSLVLSTLTPLGACLSL